MKTAAQIKRYKEIGKLLWKYGRADLAGLMHQDGLIDPAELDAANQKQAGPDDLANDLEAMGPTYVKLAQILSGRSDLLPVPYLQALARLQDKVKPFPFSEVEEIVSTELGARISKAFSSFDEVPIAAASLGQVHCASLRDGRRVAVKVQRPDIQQQITEDFEVLGQIARFVDEHTELGRRHRFSVTLEEFRVTVQQELDYEREAQNLLLFAKNLQEFNLVHIPRPIFDYCTQRVLTMDYIDGQKITALGPLARLDMNGRELAQELFRAYLKQVLVDGVFHADPHPGNVFLTSDRRIALLDLGMVGHTTHGMQENLLRLLLAISDHDSDEAAEIVTHISQTSEYFNRTEFHRRLAQLLVAQQGQGLHQINIGRSLLEVSRNACDNGLFVPSELTLLGKTLLQLDEVGQILDPAFEPNEAIRQNVTEIISRRMRSGVSKAGVFNSLMEAKGFMKSLPVRLNRILEALTNAEFELKIKAVDATTVVEGIQKIANRITAGIVLASVIVGAALLTHVQTAFQVFGYPGLPIIFFLAALGGGFWLLVNIFMQDRKPRKKP